MNVRFGLKAAFRVVPFAVALWAAGCVTPTLPPDDPPEPDVELGVGVARLSGFVGSAPAFVIVHNRVSGLIFGERTLTGAYDFEVTTEPCDLLALWYTAGSFQSSSITFRPAELVGERGSCSRPVPIEGQPDAGAEADAGGEP